MNGSNFEARAFVRQSWKSKNFDPNDNPLLYESSSSDGEDKIIEEVKEDESATIMIDNKPKDEMPFVEEYNDEYEIREEDEEDDE